MIEQLCGDYMEILAKYYLEKDEKSRNELLGVMLENYKLVLKFKMVWF